METLTNLTTKAAILQCEILNALSAQIYAANPGDTVEIPFSLTPAACAAALLCGGRTEGSDVWFPINGVICHGRTRPLVEDVTFWQPWEISVGR